MKKRLKEVEVKARIKNKKELLRRLKTLGIKLGKTIAQKDKVFLPLGVVYEKIGPGTIALRIRQQNKKIIFTLKQRQEIELSALEKETEITNAEQTEQIIKLLGFYEWLSISKRRRKAKHKGYEICIDEVEKLGDFIEVEKITEKDSIKTQEELFSFLERLGVSREDRERRGYDTLMHLLKK